MGNRKTNPSKKPATQADVNRARREAMRRLLYLVLFVLIDKHDAPYEDIQQLAEEINYLADSVTRGYVTWADIERVVTDDYGVALPW